MRECKTWHRTYTGPVSRREENTVHAVVVTVTVHDREAAVSQLNEQVVPRERSAPGFVASYWIALPNGKGRGTIVFDSEAAAQAVAAQVGAPGEAVTIDSVEVCEVVANT
jgi:hypothetical protein